MDLTNKDKRNFGDMTDAEQGAILLAIWRGDPVEYMDHVRVWNRRTITSAPMDHFVYRLAPTKPSIDWSQVAKGWDWLATASGGLSSIYRGRPERNDYLWYDAAGDETIASAFSSFRPGTCDWRDSLIQRPEGE